MLRRVLATEDLTDTDRLAIENEIEATRDWNADLLTDGTTNGPALRDSAADDIPGQQMGESR